MGRSPSQPITLFYCYARKDRALRDELDRHLASLRHSGLISAWYDGAIIPGTAWEREIKAYLDTAQIILLLVSSDFLQSNYCYHTEMKRAIERHAANEARVVPVLLRPVDWTGTLFSQLQMLPTNAQPVTLWRDRDEAFEDVAKGIRRVVNDLLTHVPNPEPSRKPREDSLGEIATPTFDKRHMAHNNGRPIKRTPHKTTSEKQTLQTLQRERMATRAPSPQQPPSQTPLRPLSAVSFPAETTSQSSKRSFPTLAPGNSRPKNLIRFPPMMLIAGMSIIVTSALLLMALLNNGILGRELLHTLTPTATFVPAATPTATFVPAAIPTATLVPAAIPTATLVPAGIITEFPLPVNDGQPNAITAGPDGYLWFTEVYRNKIGRISTTGSITEFPLPANDGRPNAITAGPDGYLWFTDAYRNKIGRISTTGSITEFPLPTANSEPNGITAGPDGNLWFTEDSGKNSYSGNKIGHISLSGTVTEFPLPANNGLPGDITAGPDGYLWFTKDSGNTIGRISTTGSITEFPLPTANSEPAGITAGPDGNLWFTEVYRNTIGRISPSGTVTEFSISTNNSLPSEITAGPDGNLWFTEQSGNKIGRISTTGSITEFPLPAGRSSPIGITAGPDGYLWFTEDNGNTIGRITSGR